MNSEAICLNIDTNQPKLSAPLSTKVPEQTDWDVCDFYQTVTNGCNFENWYTSSYNTCESPQEALLDILCLIERKQKRYHECWHSEHEDSVSSSSLPELDEDHSDDDSSISTTDNTNSTLILSRTSTIKYNQDSITSNDDDSNKPVKRQQQFKFVQKVNSIMSPLKHILMKKQKQESTPQSAFISNTILEIKRLPVSKYFMK